MTSEVIAFAIAAIVSITTAVMVVISKRIIHSALFLAAMLVAVAGLYIILETPFLAAIQILVYAGGVVTMIIFVIMIVGGEKNEW